jgi:hypothetical protein
LRAARLADEASWQTDDALGLFVLSSVLHDLCREWGEDGIIATRQLDEMRETMEPTIAAYLSAAATRDLSADDEANYLNEIIRAFLSWRSAHD